MRNVEWKKLIFHLSFDIFHLSFKGLASSGACSRLLPTVYCLLPTAHRRRLHSERNLRAPVLGPAAKSGVSCQRIGGAHAVGLHS